MQKHFFSANITDKVGFVLVAVLLAALTKGAASADAQGLKVIVAPPVVVVAPPAVVVAQDNYVYYPAYGVYYSSGLHQYSYLENGVWVSTPAPRGVSAAVLLASPSVNMDWHDSPRNHHAEMLKMYPKDWKSSGERHDRKDDVKAGRPNDDKR